MSEMSDLVRKRGSLKGRVTIFTGFLSKLPCEGKLSTQQKTELEIRIAKMDDVLPSFERYQESIELLVEEVNLAPQLQERADFENAYFEAMGKAHTLLASCKGTMPKRERSTSSSSEQSNETMVDKGNNTASNSGSPQMVKCKLPMIHLPKFNGSYETWLEYRDTFSSLIHNNASIDDINKFHYLKTTLEGSAAIVVQSLEISSANYQNAWKLLCERFNNKRLLINNHATAIFSLQPINKESPTSIRYIVDSLNKNLRALDTLQEPTNHWDTLLIHLTCTKLDNSTRRQWEEHILSLKAVNFENFITFLRHRADLLETISSQQQHAPQPAPRSASTAGAQTRRAKEQGYIVVEKQSDRSAGNQVTPVCPKCTGEHFLFDCKTFLSMTNKERADELPRLNVCFNCLKGGHFVKNCWRSTCKVCHKRHNTLVHVDKVSTGNVRQNSVPSVPETSVNQSVTLIANQDLGQVLLSTALVHIQSKDGTSVVARALLDSGSTSCFITEKLCNKLNLQTENVNTSVSGVNNQHSNLTKTCRAFIGSRTNEYDFNTSCYILPTITSNVPSKRVNLDILEIPSDIILADPEFYLPSQVDLLLGANVFWDLVEGGRLKMGKNKPVLCQTKLGWVISGYCPTTFKHDVKCNFIQHNEIDDSLTRFWQLDESSVRPERDFYSPEQLACEEHFVKNTTRLPDGRFCVRLPLKEPETMLGSSYLKAEKSFLSLERRLEKDGVLKSMYTNFIHEYEQLSDMSRVTDPGLEKQGNFLPHHGVLRTSSLTTKLRVVFNASSPTASGVSLNDILMVGPTIQDDIVAILLRFRHYKYVFSGDVEKMYRRIVHHTKDRHLLQILWRDNPSENIGTYQLNTVTYGTASAPFLAIRCLKELSLNCEDPVLAEIIAKDFYVDDFLSGASSKEEANRIISEVSQILQGAGMHLRKWRCNDKSLIENFIEDDRDLNLGNLDEAKTLGLGWKSSFDELFFSIDVNVAGVKKEATKRTILSAIATIFDPLGLVAPCVVQCKILLQRLWLHKLSWDESVPSDVLLQWNKIVTSLPALNEIRIPRPVITDCELFEFHIFTDASEGAYGACLYVRSVNAEGNKSVARLLLAKSRVSPITPVTIPRLELCGALVGAQLYAKAIRSFRLKPWRCVFWSDSSIVLGWLRMLPSRLKVYVRNRVADILELTKDCPWRHVPTELNPADYVSRGLDAKKMTSNEMWWNGPGFLTDSEDMWPKNIYSESQDLPEVKSETVMTSIVDNNTLSVIDVQKYSNLMKLLRVTAYVFRFILNLRTTRKNRVTGHLERDELHRAKNYLTKVSQMESFASYNILKNNGKLHQKDSLTKLNPFVDTDGLMRVGGRLSNSEYNYEQKHPIILSSHHPFTRLLFDYEHTKLLHAGPQAMLSSIRQSYWPIGGRNLAKSIYYKCVLCTRMKGVTISPIMGNLPSHRVHFEHAFQVVGVDYAGPILAATKKGRGCSLYKVYIVVFVCFATKAMHLEVVSDLTSEGFMSALFRFISRRGVPSDVYADNGTQFVGAYNELKRFLASHTKDIAERAANHNIRFHFVPPYSPHFAGMAEAGVKSTKHHLTRVLGNSHLTFEELCTVIYQIEAILNSRPITPLSVDPNDMLPLTPGHFLIGRPLTSVPSPSYVDINCHRLNRYQRLQQLQQHFWTRWSKEYISQLQDRQKWRQSKGTLDKNMMVVIKDDNLPPLKWKLGRIIDVFPGQDGVIRVADIRTANGVTRRSFSKICPLPL